MYCQHYTFMALMFGKQLCSRHCSYLMLLPAALTVQQTLPTKDEASPSQNQSTKSHNNKGQMVLYVLSACEPYCVLCSIFLSFILTTCNGMINNVYNLLVSDSTNSLRLTLNTQQTQLCRAQKKYGCTCGSSSRYGIPRQD